MMIFLALECDSQADGWHSAGGQGPVYEMELMTLCMHAPTCMVGELAMMQKCSCHI
jgi:hypothetical protein